MPNRILLIFTFIVLLGTSYGKDGLWNEDSRFLRARHHGSGGAFRTCVSQGLRSRGRSICQHRCMDTLRGPVCSCWRGFRLASDAASCLDIDECSSRVVRCHQICRNTLGSYKCMCRPGYAMQANGRMCAPIGTKRKISPSPRPGRHAQARHSGPLHWDLRRTISDHDYDDIYEGREEDADIEDLYNPSSDILASGKDQYHWRDRANPHHAGAVPYGELSYSSSPCQHCHQMCYWSSSGDTEVKCGCWHGYAIADGSDVGCTDIDECLVHQHLCLNGACINTIGSFICRCRPGFLLVRNICVDINECAGITGSQLCDQVCINTPGSYQCSCHSGYSILDNGRGKQPSSECMDIDECSLGVCSHLCSNYPGGFLCSCPQGMELHHDGRTCFVILGHNVESDIDLSKHEDYGNNRHHPPNSFLTTSEQVIGAQSLSKDLLSQLDPGRQNVLNGAGNTDGSCVVDCLNGGICANGKCYCPAGITGEVCHIDINECLSLPPDICCTHGCTNTFGSYLCSCPPGYFLNADHRSCSPIGCVPSCMNGGTCDESSGKCICLPGYTGAACDVDVNECGDGNVCEHVCQNTPGSFFCLCLGRGKILGPDKRSCVMAPETGVCIPSCQNGGTCQMTPGDRSRCICPKEFEGHFCQLDVNECSRNSSLCSHLCVNLHGGYRCLCPANFEGSLDESDGETPCIPDGGTAQSHVTSQQTYPFLVKEETHLKKNTSSENTHFINNHFVLSSERKDKNSASRLKVLIEIIVSTVSNPACNTSQSVYAPIYIAVPPKHDLQNSHHNSTVVGSTTFGPTVTIHSSVSISSDSEVSVTKKEVHDEMDRESATDFTSASFYPINLVTSLLPNGSIEHSLLTGNVFKNEAIFKQIDTIASKHDKNETAISSSVFSLQSVLPHHESDNKGVLKTPILNLELTSDSSNVSFINVNPLNEEKNSSLENFIVPSAVERRSNSTDTNDSLSIQMLLPVNNQSVSVNSQQIASTAGILPGNVDAKDINLSSELVQIDVPSNLSSNLFSVMESNGEEFAGLSKNKSIKSQENNLSSNITKSQENFLDYQNNLTEEVPIKIDEIGNMYSIVNQTAVFKGIQNVTTEGLPVENGEIVGNVSSVVIQEDINETVFKEGEESELKTEKPSLKKPKSKKGKKNRRKGRKVLKLNQDFQAMNQVIHLTDDKEENLIENGDLLMEIRESEGNISLGGRYFEIIDYGDEDNEWSVNRHRDVFNHTKVSPGLPSSSVLPNIFSPLRVILKERPGASELECHYSGKKFLSRSTFFRDEKNCTQCICKDGEIRCAPRHCPPPHCESPIEGDCCSYCPGDCVFEQQVYLPGERFSPHLDPCRECRCEKGARAVCQDIVCPPLNCDPEFRAIMPGECCPACLPPEPGCFHRGRFFYQGQLWVRQEGGCHACLCKKDSEVQCNPVVCVVNCQHPQFVTGECCPLCDGCQHHNHKYSDQQIFPHPTDKCSLCQCQQGNITCFPKPCGSNCSHSYKLNHDQCCPECKDCLFNGHRISNGSSLIISQETCKECSCMSGEVTCKESHCVANCVLESKTWPSGAEFSPGHDPCTVCRCWDDNVTCQAISCPSSCSHGILLPGSCCLHCEQCDYQGKLYNDLEVFLPNEDKCTRCSCNKGNVICEDVCSEEMLSQIEK